MDINLPTFVVFLATLAGPAGTLALLAFFSDYIRNLREQGDMDGWKPWQVQLMVAAVTLVVPLIALAITTFVPQTTLAALEPLWAIIGTWAVAYLGTLGIFKLSKLTSGRSVTVNNVRG